LELSDWGLSGELWLLIEYVPDGSLDEQINSLLTEQKLEIIASISDALVHARGVAHLDIKPGNILMDDMTPKLADWGLAKVAFGDDDTNTQLGMSPPYAAPEQIDQTRGERDHRTDIYQLGVTAYELLTGQLPYPPEQPESLERRILIGDPTPPSELSNISPAIDEVILRAMAPNQEERYEAPIQFRNAIEKFT
jgi:serine/threonine protein kinase